MGMFNKKKKEEINGVVPKDKKKVKAEKTFLGSGRDELIDHEVYMIDTNLVEIIAPDGMNVHNNSHLVINDNGNELYIRTFYISELPNNANFGVTFANFLNFPDSVASVHIHPLKPAKASKSLDNDVTNLETQNVDAIKHGDSNRQRKLAAKINNINSWASRAENNISRLSEVCFLISIYGDTVDELNKRTGDLFHAVRKNSIGLVNCYSYQYEAYLANQPLNDITRYVHKSGISGLPRGFSWHRMDQESLSTIFNHTTTDLYHEDGIYIGYNLADKSPIIHDLYDKTHKGYGCVIAGTTGGGKSLLVKLLESRYLPSGFRFVSLDSESPGKRGEYSVLAERFGGVNYYFAPGSEQILNPFEIDSEEIYDETTGGEEETLSLDEKITDTKHIILSMIDRSKGSDILGLHRLTIGSICNDIIQDLYRSIGLVNGVVESLYEYSSSQSDKILSSGKKKKKLPTLTDFYTVLVRYKNGETNPKKLESYNIMIDSLKEYIRNLVICNDCGVVHTVDEFEKFEKINELDTGVRYRKCKCGGKVERIQGTQPYYDGQSTISIKNKPIVNIDISQLNENEKPIAQAIALAYIKEVFIKKNAMNPLKAKKLGVIFDEVNKAFKYPDARELINMVYRIARKRYVAPITATQSIADYAVHEDTVGIIKNATTLFILAHKVKDMIALSELTELDQSQIRNTVTASVGECYLVDNGKSIHVQIDYLQHVEAPYLETDVKKLRELRQREIKGDDTVA